ncbi:Trappc3 [Scenedesmus sp. PABB004]|nr:Trappc3 [Scenedesmus sp. PABB004]
MADLKRLQFVPAYASQASQLAEGIYRRARGFVPGFAEAYASQAEETALRLGAPYLAKAQDSAGKLLAGVDGQVDAGLASLAGLLAYSRELHDKNMSTYQGAKEQYYGLVAGSVDKLKAALDPAPYVQWASGKVEYWADPDKIVDSGVAAAGKVAAFGPVPTVVKAADPLIKTSFKTYGSVHDTVVALPVYKKLWELVWSTSSTLQESWPAKKFMEVGYPVVAPLADPLCSNITNSKYLKQLETHLKPLCSAVNTSVPSAAAAPARALGAGAAAGAAARASATLGATSALAAAATARVRLGRAGAAAARLEKVASWAACARAEPAARRVRARHWARRPRPRAAPIGGERRAAAAHARAARPHAARTAWRAPGAAECGPGPVSAGAPDAGRERVAGCAHGPATAAEMSAEIFTLTYGSIVRQLIADCEDLEEVNTQLDKMGYNIGVRLVEEFLSKSRAGRCGSFREAAEVVARQALPMFLNVSATVTNWSADGSECSLVLTDNPLADFVELPDEYRALRYSNLLPGVIRGALEMVNIDVDCTFAADMLKGADCYELRLRLKAHRDEAFPFKDDD